MLTVQVISARFLSTSGKALNGSCPPVFVETLDDMKQKIVGAWDAQDTRLVAGKGRG
jgi:hypothetical protein